MRALHVTLAVGCALLSLLMVATAVDQEEREPRVLALLYAAWLVACGVVLVWPCC